MTYTVDVNQKPPAVDKELLSAFQRLIGSVFRLNGELLSTAEELAQDMEIKSGRWQTIAILRYGALTVSQISRRLGVTRQSSRKVVQRLEAGNLVELKTNPDHARAPLVTLTDKGLTVMDTLNERQAMLTHIFTDGLKLKPEQIDQLAAQLNELGERPELFEIRHSPKK